MFINPTGNVSFKEIYTSNYLNNTPQQLKLIEYLENELKKPYPTGKRKKNYLKFYEKHGYNVYLNQGNTENSVDVYIARKNPKTKEIAYDETTYVGSYTDKANFDLSVIDNVYQKDYAKRKKNWIKSHSIGILAIGLAAIMSGLIVYMTKIPSKLSKKEALEIVLTDSIKFNKDSLNYLK